MPRRRRIELDPRFETPADTRVITMSDFGSIARLRRRELGLTQRDVAQMCGLSMRLVGEIERGKERVGVEKLLALLDVLNMTMVVHVEGK